MLSSKLDPVIPSCCCSLPVRMCRVCTPVSHPDCGAAQRGELAFRGGDIGVYRRLGRARRQREQVLQGCRRVVQPRQGGLGWLVGVGFNRVFPFCGVKRYDRLSSVRFTGHGLLKLVGREGFATFVTRPKG